MPVPALTDSRSRCLTWSGLTPGNIRAASVTTTVEFDAAGADTPRIFDSETEPKAGKRVRDTISRHSPCREWLNLVDR